MAELELSYCAQEVRAHDPERYLTALFAPADRREALFALYAFNLEVARAREQVREPMMGLLRLQWWRDAVGEIYAGRPRAHEVVRALAAAVAAHSLDRAMFERLLDARERDMEPEPPTDLAALRVYAEGSAATLVELALAALGKPSATVGEAGRGVGIAWALTGLLRALPFHAAQRRLYLPAALLAEAGVKPELLFDRREAPPALRQVVRAVALEAGRALADARRLKSRVPRRFQSALLPATLAAGHLRRLAAAGYDVFDARVQQPPPGRIWGLALRRLVGGY
jgi:NADH dehydrogenase [ubiquinone] 1 alpha subcomplex assembly factor 6